MDLDRRHFIGLVAAGVTIPAWAGIGNYEIGVIGPSADFANSVKYGFDYHEPSVCEIANMSNNAFALFRDQVLSSPIRCKSLNLFTSPPGYLSKLPVESVVGNNVSMDKLNEYVTKALDRCKQLGGECAVWGSSASRNVPDGFSRDKAWEQIRDFLRMSDPIARSNGIVIGIEPIRAQNGNILTTGAEALKMVYDVDRPNIRMIIDYWQMSSMHETPEILLTAGKNVVHLHFARLEPHGWPTLDDNDPGYAPFFANIKKIGYRGGISIEAPGSYARDAASSLAFFRKELA
jgi:sugar phosphate isomerase/epimerase